MTERQQENEGNAPEKAKQHAEEAGIPTGTTPEAVQEEEQTGGALTNRDPDESEDPPSPS